MFCSRHQNRSLYRSDHPFEVVIQMQLARRGCLVMLAQHEQARIRLQFNHGIDELAVAHASVHLRHPEGRGARPGAGQHLASCLLSQLAPLGIQIAQLLKQQLLRTQANGAAEISHGGAVRVALQHMQ